MNWQVQSTVQNCTSKHKCCCSGSVRIQIIHFLDPDMISVLQLSKISKDVKNRKELGLKNCVFLCVKTIASFFCRMACFTLICSVRIRTVHYNSWPEDGGPCDIRTCLNSCFCLFLIYNIHVYRIIYCTFPPHLQTSGKSDRWLAPCLPKRS